MKDIFIFLFILGVILFGWPFISMFGYDLAVYLFSAWFVFIIFILIAAKYGEKADNGG